MVDEKPRNIFVFSIFLVVNCERALPAVTVAQRKALHLLGCHLTEQMFQTRYILHAYEKKIMEKQALLDQGFICYQSTILLFAFLFQTDFGSSSWKKETRRCEAGKQ